ncbi:AraC family transcriptional regulator [Paraflavitalea soli]|uniref:AraC family transcriptional regulator n=1 Tax=Paraflavitalea soli TaxID=2315862 RepID=A0A3B7MPF6_9BACT|nr:helix-turn-helix domain-containing protein [Paraflavitalea soli]AXY73455.1 AraC family transcriptional regulator [Paraflavitalea soli]
MKLSLKDPQTGGDLLLIKGEQEFDRFFHGRDRNNKYFTIIWNFGDEQLVTIDGEQTSFLPQTVLPLMFSQSFQFDNAVDMVAWQFNREFYCIVDHDKEVSCVGFLFGLGDNLFIKLDKQDQQKLQLLLDVFIEEFNTPDHIRHDMLLMLLKRLIINITKLARSKYMPEEKIPEDKFHIVRQFNLLVEGHYRSEHSVSYYAQRLNKSPKTLSNLFAIYNQKTPVQIIQERIVMEAKRLLSYTSQSVKEVSYELGFEDAAYFSNFFKKHTSLSPVDYRNNKQVLQVGK